MDSITTVTNSINQTRESSKEITKTIQNVQKDIKDVAVEQDRQRRKHQRELEEKDSLLIYKAIQEYERLNNILKKEEQAEKEFTAKHGAKEWAKVVQLKIEVEKEEKAFRKAYDSDLGKSKRLMLWCIFVASWVTYFLYINKMI